MAKLTLLFALLVIVIGLAALVLSSFVRRQEGRFFDQRIEAALGSVDCPPVKDPDYPDLYYQGSLVDTHFHIPPIADWPPEEDSIKTAKQLKGRFGGERAFLGLNIKIGKIACTLKHEGTIKTFAFFPVYEDIPEPLLEVANRVINQYPALFVPFIGASGNDGDPNGFPVTDAASLKKMLAVYPGLFKGFGEIGLYEREGGGSKALPPDAPRLQEIYPLVRQQNLLVYFHPGRGQLSNFEKVLAQHQDLKFIVHGEELEKDIEFLMDKYPNFYYGVELGLGEEDPEFSRLFVGDDKQKFLEAMEKEFNRALGDHLKKWKPMIERHPDRFLWGTDRGDTVWNYDPEAGEALVKLARAFIGGLDPTVQEKFAYKNAQNLIGETQKAIGYAGCSNTVQTIEGYWAVGGKDIWPPDRDYDDGSVMNWGNPEGRWQKTFEKYAKQYPETKVVWWQLCVPVHEAEQLSFTHVSEVVDAFRARLPNATIYVSSLAPYQHVCEATGTTGVPTGQRLAQELASKRADVKLGPIFSTLTTKETENDLCHLEDPGKQKMGRELREFFDKLQ